MDRGIREMHGTAGSSGGETRHQVQQGMDDVDEWERMEMERWMGSDVSE